MLADVYFSVPLKVAFPNGLTRAFESLNDTVDFLENEWPLRHGERYQRACEKCRAALARRTPVAIAREAFVAACLEAGLPVQAVAAAWQRTGSSPSGRMSA
ncbi:MULTISPECIES: DUF982 domain-containing protein [unclassified Rhizobium]|uniref:DUF982 domain-containing protein n=1 Tax=unclassified Rhizobium TaxID=2613769 RepID=UPI0007153E49|nr:MULTISPECIES: DUF982 domain-containing protein [unclassified Rhizobium]KQS85779.1 hypothetical protein ASG50_28915 [Rhizobium sp. Leaf386]KQT02819.1 hypothetical protein ASG42_25325 [Rhizobium sp. Leaf391]KQU06019.1 hypothetical protein ASG68_25090 [Rhizobium sp. Leaf453]